MYTLDTRLVGLKADLVVVENRKILTTAYN
jgi:hypothetical protein